MRFAIIKNRKAWYTVSILLLIASFAGYFMWGFNLSLQFTGGIEMKFEFKDKSPTVQEMRTLIDATEKDFNTNKLPKEQLDIGTPLVVQSGDNALNVRLRMPETADQAHQDLYKKFKTLLDTTVSEKLKGQDVSSRTISPSVGQVLKQQAVLATFLAILAIVLYIVFAFRQLPKNYNPWVFGINTIVALLHDVIIMTGVFIYLGHFFNVEMGPYFITALLTILGYSVNDTIVVFDRVRENLALHSKDDIEKITEDSLWQTMARSLNTSFTVLITLGALLVFGADSIQTFALALFVGVVLGTYSSLFTASPLLVTFKNYLLRK